MNIIGLSPSPQSKKAQPSSRRFRFTSNIVGPILLASDIVSLAISAPLAIVSYSLLIGQRINAAVHLFAFFIFAGSFLLVRSSRGSYRRTLVDLGDAHDGATLDAVITNLLASAVIWQLGMIDNYSRGMSILSLLCLILCLHLSRLGVKQVLRALSTRGAIEQRIAFYGADSASIETVRKLLSSLSLPHLRFVGVADDRPRLSKIEGLEMIGGYRELLELARRGKLDQVLITVPNIPAKRLHQIVEELSEVAVDISLIPSQAVELAPDYQVQLLGTVPVLNLWQRPFRDVNQLLKRTEDLVLAGAALLFLAPLMAVSAAAIRATSRGNIFFVQPRVGFNNEIIEVLKFRTMYADKADLGAQQTTTRGDPRITPVGRFLRRFSIDELPQLLNVLRGDMSLIGPRPHALEMKIGDRYYHDAVRGYSGRHRVRPGITGLAQVKGLRGEIRTISRAKARVELDKYYIEHWSLWLDTKILLLTFRALFFDKDAY